MRTLLAFLTPVLLFSSPLLATAQENPPSQATPEAVQAYLEDCIARNVQADPVSKFGTNFRGLDLRSVPFKGVHRVGTETILTGADFSGADLRGVDFGAATLEGAVFRGADLGGSRFTTAKFDGADFSDAKIGDAHFQECWFTKANLAELDFSQATLNGCFFKHANLDGAVLQGVRNDLGWRREMDGASLRGVDLSGFDFTLANLSEADLTGANLIGVNFEQANLRDANLTDARLGDIIWDAAILDGVTGLEDAKTEAIQGVADRAGFEAAQAAEQKRAGIKKSLFTWSYRLTVLLTFACCGLAWRRSSGKSWPLTLILVNLVALVPPVAFYLVQNQASALLARFSHRTIGGLWITTWPLSVFGALAMIGGGLGLAIYFALWAAKAEAGEIRARAMVLIIAAILTVIHGGFLIVLAFNNAPTV